MSNTADHSTVIQRGAALLLAAAVWACAGPHTVGSLMISRIDSGSGLDAVMAVLADPRRLLLAYNEAVRSVASDTGAHVFDSGLAAEAASMGEG